MHSFTATMLYNAVMFIILNDTCTRDAIELFILFIVFFSFNDH